MALSVRIIPCLDVSAGRVVKGVNFRDLRDAGDPVELARSYYAQGADEVTFLDVSATVDGRETMYDGVARAADEVFIPLTVEAYARLLFGFLIGSSITVLGLLIKYKSVKIAVPLAPSICLGVIYSASFS